jgi:AraC-like DNA-binding protein
MALFRQTCGLTIVEYLTQYRVAAAQRLQATTDAGPLEIALEAGFGSASRFYAAFRCLCSKSPCSYRAALRRGPCAY